MGRRTRSYAAALVAAVMLAGCTQGNGESVPTTTAGPGTPSTATPSATTSASATTTAAPTFPADVPAEARANTPQGAIAFVKHFFATLNRAYTTPAAGLISPLSTDGCESCAGFEERATSYVADGRRYDRPALNVVEVSLNPETPPADAQIIDAVLEQLPARIVDTTGHLVKEITAEKGVMILRILRVKDVWLVDSVKVLE
ncbi:MAG: hypothetical protein IPL45_13380 [Actinomycetales bacterium]|nr:hypothetical protein [Actinomycetales bacterium]